MTPADGYTLTSSCLWPKPINHFPKCRCYIWSSWVTAVILCVIPSCNDSDLPWFKKKKPCLCMKTTFSTWAYRVRGSSKKKIYHVWAVANFCQRNVFNGVAAAFDAWDRDPELFSHNIRGDDAKLNCISHLTGRRGKIHWIFFFNGRLPCSHL